MKRLEFKAVEGLPLGFDAADLVDAGCTPDLLTDLRLLELVEVAPPDPERAAAAGDQPGPTCPQRRRADRAAAVSDAHRELVLNIGELIRKREVEPDAADGWRNPRTGMRVGVSLADLGADVWFELRELGYDLTKELVTNVLSVLARRHRILRREQLVASFTGRAATDAGRAALVAWVRCVTGRDPSTTDVRVMAHWLWLVKRLATGRRTEYDLMPIVFGGQGGGKSTITERLVEPLAELATTISAQTLTDERRFRQLGVCLVGRWEEMQGAGKAEIEALKHTVTAPELSYRELATHSMVIFRRTCSFIGTSNNSVDVMVGDTTGARRFYQLDAPARLDFELMDSIDYRAVWDAVSEAEPAPIHECIAVVREQQAGLVFRDAVSLWLESEGWGRLTVLRVDKADPLVVEPYDWNKGEEFDDLAARFKHWCNTVGQNAIGAVALAKRLKQEGFTRTRPRVAPGAPRPFMYHRPREPQPAPDPAAPAAAEPAAPPRPPRATRMAGDPTDAEDVLRDDGPPGTGGGSYAFE